MGLKVQEYSRAWAPGVFSSCFVEELTGKSWYMNSLSTPTYLPKFMPPPTTKFPPVLMNLLRSPCGIPKPPPTLKRYLPYCPSSCAWDHGARLKTRPAMTIESRRNRILRHPPCELVCR